MSDQSDGSQGQLFSDAAVVAPAYDEVDTDLVGYRGPMCRAAKDPAGFSEFSDGSDPVSGGSAPPSVPATVSARSATGGTLPADRTPSGGGNRSHSGPDERGHLTVEP